MDKCVSGVPIFLLSITQTGREGGMKINSFNGKKAARQECLQQLDL